MVVEEILEFSKRGEFNKVLSTYNQVNVATLSVFDRFQIQLELAYTYCRSGYIRKTFREINKINSDPEWSKFENNNTLSIRYNIILGLTYLKRGDYKKSVLYYEEAYLQALSSKNVEFVADTIIRLGSHCFFTLDFDLALEKFEEAYKLAKSVGAQDLVFESLDWIGYIHLYLGNFEKAEKFCQEAFDLAKEIGHSKGLADIQMDLGAINYVQGNLSLALEKYNESLWQYIENGDYDSTAWIHLKVGELHAVRGAFGISLVNYYKALRLYEELQLNGGIGISLLSVGRVYLDMDEIEEASSFINKGMDILHGIENPSALKFGLWTFLNLNIIEGNMHSAYEIFDQLTAIDSKSEKDPIGEMYLRHSKALLLKSSKRAREKYQGQELFKSIIDDNIASAWIKMDALKHLLELLIMEYHNFKEPEVLKILEECLDHMIEFSDTQELVPSIVEANRLKSIFLQDLGDTETANLCLEKAYETAQSNHYSWLSRKLLEIRPDLDTVGKPLNNDQTVSDQDVTIQVEDVSEKVVLDREIHSLPRFTILYYLFIHNALSFSKLKKLTRFTSGKLHVHCNKLQEAGLIYSSRELMDDKFSVVYTISPEGISQYQQYIGELNHLIGSLKALNLKPEVTQA